MRRGPEEFTNFYTNRRPRAESLFNTDEQHGTTSVSVSADEVTTNSSPLQENGELFRPEADYLSILAKPGKKRASKTKLNLTHREKYW